MYIMTARILQCLIAVVAVFATCLEGRYHLEATGLKHYRHDKHRQVSWNQEPSHVGSRKPDWDGTVDENYDDGETATVDLKPKEKTGVANGRRISGKVPRGVAAAAHPGRSYYDTKKRGKPLHPHPWRDFYYAKSAPGWRRWPYKNWHLPAPPGRDKWPWAYRKPSRFVGRYDYDEEYDDGYDADDEDDDGYYPPMKSVSKARRNWSKTGSWREKWAPSDDDDYDDEYDQDYEEYDGVDEAKRAYWLRRGKYVDDLEEEKYGKGGEGYSAQNEVPKTKKKGKVNGEKPEDLNEVDEVDGDDGDVWDDADDEYDENSDFEFAEPKKDQSSLKAIDELIRRLTAADTTTTTPRPVPTPPRRGYRNIDAEKIHPARSGAKTTLQHRATGSKKFENGWGATSTTARSYAKYTDELKRVTNSSRNDVVGAVIGKKTNRENAPLIDVKKPQLMSQITETDTDAKTKSLEQDYEEYENDGSEDGTQDVENESYKKWPSEKERDYIEEENEDDTESSPSTTTTASPLLTMMKTTTRSTTTTTTTTTTTPTPPAISTRAFDQRYPRVINTRPRPNILKNFQTTSTTYPPMSEYSAYKWSKFGNRTAINNHRNSEKELNSAEIEVRNVVRHAQQMRKETACRLPKPKVISVRDVYLSPSKSYNPSCTILYRCADDTGCCSPEHTCVPKHLHSVELSFYATGVDGKRVIEKLKFDNHTECQCRLRAPPPPPPPPPTTTMRPCKCPSLFTPKHTPERGCQCECPDNQLRCLRQRRGKDYFTRNDQWCIKSEQCTIPPCDFGEYMRMPGRCPLKSERPDKVNYYSSGPRHSWI